MTRINHIWLQSILLQLLILALAGSVAADSIEMPVVLTASDRAYINASIQKDSLSFESATKEAYDAYNQNNKMHIDAFPHAMSVKTASKKSVQMTASQLSYGKTEIQLRTTGVPRIEENTVSYDKGHVVEWYKNTRQGLKQGFTVAQGPNVDSLALTIDVRSRLSMSMTSSQDEILFTDKKGNIAFKYNNLKVFDARGNTLPSSMSCTKKSIILYTDTRNATYPITIDPLIINGDVKIYPPNTNPGDRFGYSMDTDGDVLIVGAEEADIGSNSDQGAAYIFQRCSSSTSQWKFVTRLTAFDGSANDHYGYDVAIYQNTVVVGANGDDTYKGGAYVYINLTGTWSFVQKLTADLRLDNDSFGSCVDIDRNVIAVGAPGTSGGRGSVHVFKRRLNNTREWELSKKIESETNYSSISLGSSVCIDGDTIVAGAYTMTVDGESNAGGAYIFKRDYGGIANWGRVKKLVPFDPEPQAFYGSEVVKCGDTIVVASIRAPRGPSYDRQVNAGAAYVYLRDMGGTTNWGFLKKLVNPLVVSDSYFGWDLALKNDILLISTVKQEVFAYKRHRGATNRWGFVTQIKSTDSESSDAYGQALAISESTIAVSAKNADIITGTDNRGAAYIRPVERVFCDVSDDILYPALSDGRLFGCSIDMSDDTLVVGAKGENDGRGAVYIFKRSISTTAVWQFVKKIVASDPETNSFFGSDIAINKNLLVVGAPNKTVYLHKNAGKAYLFRRNQGGIDNWGEIKTFDNGAIIEENDYFGSAVDISGDMIAIGIPYFDSGPAYPNIGRVQIFLRNKGGESQWNVAGGVYDTAAYLNGHFGSSISIFGNTIAISAPDAIHNGNTNGVVYIVERDYGNNADTFKIAKKILSSSYMQPHINTMGSRISLHGDTLAVANFVPGSTENYVALYERDKGGNGQWGEYVIITNEPSLPFASSFASDVHIAGNMLLIASTDNMTNNGAISLYQREINTTGKWQYVDMFCSTNTHESGYANAIFASGDTLIAGVPYADYGTNDECGKIIMHTCHSVIGTPFIDILTPTTTTEYSETTCIVNGTHNESVIGRISWSNQNNSASFGSFDAQDDGTWSREVTGLVEYNNHIIFYATNYYNVHTSEAIDIFRYPDGVSAPDITITSTPETVTYLIDKYTLAGTNNAYIIPPIQWENLDSSETGEIYPTVNDTWQITNVSLVYGDNRFTFTGQSAIGEQVSDSITITRGISDEILLFSPLNNLVTNALEIDFDVHYGTDIDSAYRFISILGTNDYIPYNSSPTSFTFPGEGVYQWTARGFDETGTTEYLADQTNTIKIVTTPPRISLLTPENNAVFTNKFAIDLLATYGIADLCRQLTTNNGASWFDYSPGHPVIFNSTGTWYWSARGQNIAGMSYAERTHRLTIMCDLANTVFLLSPSENEVLTNNAPEFRIYPTENFDLTDISTNNTAFIPAFTFPGTLDMGCGSHLWTARGRDVGPTVTYPSHMTNHFEIIDDSCDAAVRLYAFPHNAYVRRGHVHFDVLWHNVSNYQISTNNAVSWMEYEPVLEIEQGIYQWTARGTDSLDQWVYATRTNTLFVNTGVSIDITTTPVTVTFDTETYTIAGHAGERITGDLVWSNSLSGLTGNSPASEEWTMPSVPLIPGTNTITITATNIWGESVQDSVDFVRGQPGTGVPMISITNTPDNISVPYETSTYTIGGEANSNVVTDMAWSMDSTGINGYITPAIKWITPSLILDVGSNTFTISGTNLFGDVAQDTYTIIRKRRGTGIPVVVITTETQYVDYSFSTCKIAGTNNPHIVAYMHWSNTSSGNNGTFAAAPHWHINGIPLITGTNVIYVTGTNYYDQAGYDTHTIVRGQIGSAPPYICITSKHATVVYSNTSYRVAGTNNIHVVGTILWENNRGGSGFVTNVAQSWDVLVNNLAVGTNVITCTATNLFGVVTNDSTYIVRGDITTAEPFVDIVSTNIAVPYETQSLLINGTNNASVVGAMYWTNSSGVNAASGNFAAGTNWSATIIPLFEGVNAITVFGTNALGVSASDTIDITRRIRGTGIPFVDITTPDQLISYYTHTFTINGTNSPHVIGTMCWTNVTSHSCGHFDATSHWNTLVENILEGTNLIVVVGTNLYGQTASDTVTIYRVNYSIMPPFIDITTPSNEIENVSYDIAAFSIFGTNNLSVLGSMTWSNKSSHVSGSIPATTHWTIASAQLKVGTNDFVISGTNALGTITNDYVTLVRGKAGTGLPYISITSAPHYVTYDILSVTVAGTNNPNVVGNVQWTNSTGDAGVIPATSHWNISTSVHVGTNVISLAGTNMYGVYAYATTTVIRLPVGSGTPFVDITTPDDIVIYTNESYSITGTNNIHVTGDLVWNNSLGGTGSSASTSEWSIMAIPLSVGDNIISVIATNVLGVAATDTVSIVRRDITTAPPFVDVLHPDIINVINDVNIYNGLNGSNNFSVVGGMSWTNSRGVISVRFPAAQNWTINNIGLSVGTNVIIVTGTNVLGSVTNAAVSIVRGGTGTGTPAIDIFTSPFSVDYSVTSCAITGTINSHVVSDIIWTNYLISAGSVSKNNPWNIQEIPLHPGNNYITVYATNIYGVCAKDSIVITRSALTNGVPFVDITSTNAVVPNDTYMYSITGTNNIFVSDFITWTNEATLTSGEVLSDTSEWTIAGIPLAVGMNKIRAIGSNPNGMSSTDFVYIVRGEIGTGAPFIDILTQNTSCVHTVSSYSIEGTNNMQVVGYMQWSNFNNSAHGTIPAMTNWTSDPVPLVYGDNYIMISGTNTWNVFTQDYVRITREYPDSSLPLLHITSRNTNFTYDTFNTDVFGTNNSFVVGYMYWTNMLTLQTSNLYATSMWTIANLQLDVGTNVIFVYGTNTYGKCSFDSIEFIRGIPGTGIPVIDITNTTPTNIVYDFSYTIAGLANTNVVGYINWQHTVPDNTIISGGVINVTPHWEIANVDLIDGTNIISVYATNLFGFTTNDVIQIITPEPTIVLFIILLSGIFYRTSVKFKNR